MDVKQGWRKQFRNRCDRYVGASSVLGRRNEEKFLLRTGTLRFGGSPNSRACLMKNDFFDRLGTKVNQLSQDR